jgi:hypothetical protein
MYLRELSKGINGTYAIINSNTKSEIGYIFFKNHHIDKIQLKYNTFSFEEWEKIIKLIKIEK